MKKIGLVVDSGELRMKINIAESRLHALGYIWSLTDDEVTTGKATTKFHLLGAPKKRLLWMGRSAANRSNHPQILVAQDYKGGDLGWQEIGRLTLDRFVLDELPSVFTGEVPDFIRRTAQRLSQSSIRGMGYYFKSPKDGEENQFLYLKDDVHFQSHRVEIIPNGPDDAVLIFEKLHNPEDPWWEHVHRTTALNFINYPDDVPFDRIRCIRAVSGDPDYIALIPSHEREARPRFSMDLAFMKVFSRICRNP